MVDSLLAPLLALLATGFADDDSGTATGRPPLVVRVHSLAGLVDYHGRCGGTLSLLPGRVASGNNSASGTANESFDRADAIVMSGEDLVVLLRDVVDPKEWEDGTSRIDLVAENRLIAIAPAETQDRIADFLGNLTAALAPSVLLDVKVLRGAAAGDGAGSGADFKTADKFDEQLGVARRVELALLGNNITSATSFDSTSTVFDWDVEIAQAAASGTPAIATTRAGVELTARAIPTEGGMFLALMVREAEHAADPVARLAEGDAQIVAQQLVSERPGAGLVQHPRLGFVAFAGTCFLPAGKALLLPVSVQTHLGEIAFTLDLRLRGDLPTARASFDVRVAGEGAPLSLGFVTRGLTALGGIEQGTLPARLFDSGWGTMDEPCWQVGLTASEEADRTIDLARSIASVALESGRGSVAGSGPYLRMLLPSEVIDAVASAAATLNQRETGEISGRIVAGDREVARFRVPYVDGRRLSLWAGAQGARVADWDVEVANDAQIFNPVVESWVDGFALALCVTRDARGRPLVHANGVVNLLDGEPQKVELRDHARLAIETIRAKRSSFDELRGLPEKGGPFRFGSGDLAVELDVRSR